jgi:chromosome segregation ATPase
MSRRGALGVILSLVDGEEYTAQEAARILRTTERTIRRRLERGDLEGRRDPTTGRWFVSARAVTAAMPERPPKASASLEPSDASSEVAGLRARVEDLQRQLGRLEGRLELTERTESSLRDDLERERRQHLEDLERERHQHLEDVQRERDERLEAQKTAEALEHDRIRLERERFIWEARQKELEEALQAERSKKGFWARLFGG